MSESTEVHKFVNKFIKDHKDKNDKEICDDFRKFMKDLNKFEFSMKEVGMFSAMVLVSMEYPCVKYLITNLNN